MSGTLRESTRHRLDLALAQSQRTNRVPSTVAGVVRDGALAWWGSAGTLDGRPDGPAPTPDTQYRLGSITKTFIAVAVLQLRDAGRLRLSDAVDTHVPGTTFGAVTIEHLLSHTAGLQAETNGPWWERTPGVDWAALRESGVGHRFRAGRRFHYTNVGYAALGRLVEQLTGRSWFRAVDEAILRPLEMSRTTAGPTGAAAPGWAVHPFADLLLPEPEHDAGAMAPAGQLWSTSTDLARWARFIAGDTGGVLAEDSLSEMFEPHQVDDSPGAPWTGAHGLGWQLWNVDGRRYAGHGGSMPGFLAHVRVDLDSGDGALTMLNSTSATAPLAPSLLDLVREHDPAPARPWVVGTGRDLLDLLGTWHWGPAVSTVRLVGDHLVLGEPGVHRGSRFRAVGPDHWEGLDGYFTGEPLRVIRRPDGTVSHLDLASFRFTRTPYDPGADIPGGVSPYGWS